MQAVKNVAEEGRVCVLDIEMEVCYIFSSDLPNYASPFTFHVYVYFMAKPRFGWD